MKKILTLGSVIIGAVIVTALGIDAADTFQGQSGTLLGQLAGTDGGVCPSGMVEVAGLSFTCVDAYEASPSEDCPQGAPNNPQATADNMSSADCSANSSEGKTPWRFIAREQAAAMCARAGKRLPTATEWYQAALGSRNESTCNTESRAVSKTGDYSECKSPAGAYDLVGNVWEWVSDDVIDGQYNSRTLPTEGYVTQVDQGGVATMTDNDSGDPIFGDDYFWTHSQGAFGMIRGGFYSSESDAGIFSVQAKTAPTFSGAAIGFRCVR